MTASNVPDRGAPLPSLTGVRAIAALGVFISHIEKALPNSGSAAAQRGLTEQVTSLLDQGATGVSLFFVLSGFVLAWTWSPGIDRRTFLQRRFARVWPAHFAVWAAFLVALLAGMGERPGIVAGLASLFLLQCWIPGQGIANAVNPVSWTLSCEAFFYLTFPFLIGPIRRLDARRLAVVAAMLLGIGAIGIILVLEPRRITVSTFPVFREWEFLLGVVAGTAVRGRALRRVPTLAISVPLLVASMVVSTGSGPSRGVATFLTSVAYLLIICRLALLDLTGREGLLHHRIAQRAGELSFAFYLVQLLTFGVLVHWWFRPTTGIGSAVMIAVWFVLTVAVAVAVHLLVEKPAVAALRTRGADGRRVHTTS